VWTGTAARHTVQPQAHNDGPTINPAAHPRRSTVIYKFKSKAAGDVIMLGPNGDQVLRLIGKEPAAQGIIEPAQMAAAIAALEQAIAADEAARKAARQPPVDAPPNPQADVQQDRISLRQRAWPLVEMMKRALNADQEIVWGV
jgi:hypothetical protein